MPLILKKQNGKHLLSLPDKVLVISDFVKEVLAKELYIEDTSKIEVIKNGANLSLFKIDLNERKAIRDSFNFTDNDFVVMFCGRVCEEKGIFDLLQAFNKLPSNYKLLVVGSSHFADKIEDPNLKMLIDDCKHNKNIIFTGFIDNSELYKYYSAADLFCSPSKCNEAAGLVNIEAMACSLPVLTTRDGGIPEYTGEAASFIDSEIPARSIAENILRISNDKKIRLKMQSESLKQSKLFSTEQYYENFALIINNLFEKEVKHNEH